MSSYDPGTTGRYGPVTVAAYPPGDVPAGPDGYGRTTPGSDRYADLRTAPVELAAFLEAPHGPWTQAPGRDAYRRPPCAAVSLDDLLLRVAETYRLLDELFAPRATREGHPGSEYGSRPRFRR